jgi:hypothetical protein
MMGADEKPDVSYADIGGSDIQKQEIREAVELPLTVRLHANANLACSGCFVLRTCMRAFLYILRSFSRDLKIRVCMQKDKDILVSRESAPRIKYTLLCFGKTLQRSAKASMLTYMHTPTPKHKK